MKRIIGVISLCVVFLMSASCNRVIDIDRDGLCVVVFENETSHALNVMLLEWVSGEQQRSVCYLEIPSGTSASESFWRQVFGPGAFSTCKIVFDDGKTLYYHRDYHSRVEDVTSPLYTGNWTWDRQKDQCSVTFKITEDYYQRAE